MGEKEKIDTSTNFLGTLLWGKIGGPPDEVGIFLQEMQNSISMMNPYYYKTASGEWHDMNDQNAEWIQKYSLLQYYKMFGKDGD